MKKIVFLMIVFISSPLVWAQVGEIVYIADQVEMIRDGEVYTELDISFGEAVENQDFFSTGPYGELDIQIYGKTGIDSEVHLSPDSSFYLEISELKQEQTGVIQLVSGSIGFKVGKLFGRNGLNVQTETALMGVRGTTFDVTTSAGGDILVTCEEGKVVCIDESGNSLFAEPGTAVEKSADSIFRRIPVAVSSLKTFKQDWQAEKVSALRANGLRALKNYSVRYEKGKREFNQAYRNLMASDDIIDRWTLEQGRGQIGSGAQLLRDKKEIAKSLIALRKSLFIFERIYFRLLELEGYYQEGAISGNLRTWYSARDFFRDFNEDKEMLKRKMGFVRYVNKMYAQRNGGDLPFGDDAFSDSGTGILESTDGFFD